MDLDYQALGRRIRAARLRSGITQEKLAEIANVSIPHMSNIENGATKVSLPTLLRISNALNVSTDELLCDSINHSKETSQNLLSMETQDCSETETKILTDVIKDLKGILRQYLDHFRMKIHALQASCR